MRELISRDTAEQLIRDVGPLRSKIEQTSEMINIKIFLTNGTILSVDYQPKIQGKKYYLVSN